MKILIIASLGQFGEKMMIRLMCLAMIISGFACSELPDYVDEAIAEYEKRFSPVYLNTPHPRMMILFSGTPGMGKSTLSCAIEQAFNGIRISADEARLLLRSLANDFRFNDKEMHLEEMLVQLIKKIDQSFNNHFIVLDRTVDGIENTQPVLDAASEMGYEFFCIRLEAPKEIPIQRIINREKDPSQHLKRFDYWWEKYQQFDLSLVDYFLDVSPEQDQINLDDLFSEIERHLIKISPFLRKTP